MEDPNENIETAEPASDHVQAEEPTPDDTPNMFDRVTEANFDINSHIETLASEEKEPISYEQDRARYLEEEEAASSEESEEDFPGGSFDEKKARATASLLTGVGDTAIPFICHLGTGQGVSEYQAAKDALKNIENAWFQYMKDTKQIEVPAWLGLAMALGAGYAVPVMKSFKDRKTHKMQKAAAQRQAQQAREEGEYPVADKVTDCINCGKALQGRQKKVCSKKCWNEHQKSKKGE